MISPPIRQTESTPSTGLSLAGVAHVGALSGDVDQVVRPAQVGEGVGNGGLAGAGHFVHPVHHPPHPVSPQDVRLGDRDPVGDLTLAQLYYGLLSPAVDSDAIFSDKS